MGHLCQFCRRSFSRKFNRDRHENQGCHKRQEEEMTSQDKTYDSYVTSFDQDNTVEHDEDTQDEYDDDVDDNVDDQDEMVDEEEEFSDEEDQSTTGAVEDDDTDPWDKLREEAVNDLNTAWEEQVEQYITQGLQKDDAELQASSLLLPAYRKRLRIFYLQYLKWYHVLKTDPVHKKVMTTLRRFMDDDGMDFAEAAEAAISKRKYLLNRLIEYEDDYKENLSDNESDEISHKAGRKRKYHESQY